MRNSGDMGFLEQKVGSECRDGSGMSGANQQCLFTPIADIAN